MAKKNILVDIDFNQNQLLNPVLQNLPEDPSTGVEGQKYFNTTNHIERIYRNGAWQNTTDEYELPAASTTTRGGVKVGSHLNVTDTDVLNADEASTTQKGVVEIATDEEVTTGTDTERVVTPHGLNVVTEPIESNIEDLQEGNFNGDWRTPTKDEWNYLIKTRSASTVSGTPNARFIAAQVNNVNGLIILPDVFTLPSGITMSYINNTSPNYSRNIYTLEQWVLLNTAGCIFLPVTGERYGTNVWYISKKGYYWSSIQNSNVYSWYFYFGSSQPIDVTCYAQEKFYGCAVRLIKQDDNGIFSISANTKCTIASSNLQYHCLNKEWRFAPNPYDVIGSNNSNIAENYDGWIDLFGYGTSGWNSGANAYQPWSSSINNDDYINQDLTNDYTLADWGVYNLKKQLHKIAFTGDFNDLENVPLGEANGIAELDINGKVPSSQLPSYVDDVVEGYYDSITDRFYEENTFITVITPVAGKSWVDISTNKSYRWTGTVYTRVDEGVQLGETSNSAYRGDRGKTAYDHATDANRVTTAQSSGLYKIAVTAEGHIASVTPVVASDIPTQDATETQKGVAELATSAEAITGTDTERVLTPKTNRDAHDAWNWFGTQAEFDALEQGGQLNEDVIYHVEMEYSIPQPTAQDEGRLLSVNSLGQYELVTIVNSENIPY